MHIRYTELGGAVFLMIHNLSKSLSSNEFLRVIDLALRRAVDNGEDQYSEKEQKMFTKMREIKDKYAERFGEML